MSGKSGTIQLSEKHLNEGNQMSDMSANFGDNAQTSIHNLQMPPSPIASMSVTETGFNVDPTEPTTPDIYFYMKSKFKSNRKAPLAYLSAQTLILSPIVIGHFTTSSSDHNTELILLFVVSILALVYYLRSAWTNPGYLIGSISDEAKKAGAYDPKMYAVDGEQNVTVDISMGGNYNGDISPDGDLSMIDNGDISPTGAGSRHAKQPSFLTKDFNISRHERQKSAMGLDSDPNMVTTQGDQPAGPEVLTTNNNYHSAQQTLQQLAGNYESGSILKANLSVNDKQHRRRIKSTLPGEYNSTNSSNTSTAMNYNDDLENQDGMAARGDRNENNNAYEAIQAKIKAAADARKASSAADKDPFEVEDKADKEESESGIGSTQATSAMQTTGNKHTTMTMSSGSDHTQTLPSLNLKDIGDGNLQTRIKKAPEMTMSIGASSDAPIVDSQPVTEEQVNSEASMGGYDGGVTTTKGIKMDTINETGENDDELSSEEEDLVLFIETKYCTVCHLEQPLRTKHCKNCDQCVATHDHHCPWIGNCVGERNKARFFYYLVIQFVQMIVAISLGIKYLVENVEEHRREFSKLSVLEFYIGLACFFTLCFSAFVLALIVFHSILASKNLTSWEYISWMRITYLKVWPKKYGSPFSLGSASANLRQFFCFNFAGRTRIYPWQMPKKLPKIGLS